jgi:hypothetical protein
MNITLVKIETFIPEEYIPSLRDELNKIGALTVDGIYDYCMSVSKVKGSWRPLAGANPYNGEIGEIYDAEEMKVEFTCRKEILNAAVETIKLVHPYEKPVINALPLLIIDDV